MRKVEIINEIVLLRQYVRQARICVISKLIREAKRLRTSSHGTEKQLEKNKTKADNLLREVFALKRIKDDEISKFGIINSEYLEDILRNPQTNDGTRAMVKVVCYKSLSCRIAEFQDKFPDYGEYISLKKTRGSPKKKEPGPVNVPERRSKRLRSDANDTAETTRKESPKETEELSASSAGTSREKGPKVAKKHGPASKEEEARGEAKEERENVAKAAKIRDAEVDSKAGQHSKAVAKIISTQATVKRFAEVLQESESRNDASDEAETREARNETAEMPKKPDDFFLQADGETSHLSTAFSYEDKNPSSEIESSSTSKASRFDEMARKQRRDATRGQKLNGRNASRGRWNAREASSAHSQGSRKSARVEERSGEQSRSAGENEGLHPSWAAKRKQQDMIKQGFQGKKIKFGED